MLSDSFEISCSKIGEIMTNGKTAGEISVGAKTYCKTWVKEQLYERRKTFTSKYTDKGNLTESDAIDYLEQALGWGFAVKNDQKKSDGFMKGFCDIPLLDTVVDVKSAYECFTFPLWEASPPDASNEWQIQGYMNLWNKPKGEVIYVLMDTPDEIIQKEIRWKLGEFFTKDDYDNLYATYIYSHLPPELRIKRFKFSRDDTKIQAIKDRVIMCRSYIDTLTAIKNDFL